MAIPFLILIQMRKCRLCLVTDCEATARTCFGKGCAAAVVLWADLDRLEYFNNKLSSSSSVGRCLRLFDYFHFFTANSFISFKKEESASVLVIIHREGLDLTPISRCTPKGRIEDE